MVNSIGKVSMATTFLSFFYQEVCDLIFEEGRLKMSAKNSESMTDLVLMAPTVLTALMVHQDRLVLPVPMAPMVQ